MNHTFIDDAKKMAKKLQLRLGSFGISLTYNQALEGVAASFGFESWSALKTSICSHTDEPQPIVDEHRCPKCLVVASQLAEIARIFGYRTMPDGTIRSQSWCRSCRAGPIVTREQNHEKTD